MRALRKGYLHLALESIKNARLRSFMTMLGIIIGVMAVIVIVAISEGVKQQIDSQSNRYGKDVLVIRPDQQASLAESALPSGATTLLTSADVDTVRQTPGVASTSHISRVQGSVTGDATVKNPLVIATTTELETILNHKVEFGGFFNAADGETAAVLGNEIAQELFSDNAPLGRKITYRGQEFTIAGVFKPFIAAPFSLEANYNEGVFIPYAAAQNILGSAPLVQEIFAKTTEGADAKTVSAAIEQRLTEAHGGSDDAVVLAADSRSMRSSPVLDLLTRMTIGTALIALLVGGVGIMNMMLLSVTERIHEIGLRKAVGATESQILRQFVTEAIALCGIGAIIGFVLAVGGVGLLRLYTSLQPVMVWPVAFAVPAIAFLAGVFFGTIPAIKAAKMDPIEALRHE